MDVLPHNIEAEQALLGAILLSNEHYGAISATLAPDHMFEPIHAQILSECGRLITSGKKATPITLKDAFPNVEVAPGVSVAKYLARLAAEGAASTYERDGYVSRVKDLAQMRAIILAANDLKVAGQSCVAPDVALQAAWDQLDNLRSSTRDDTGERGAIATMVDRILEGEAAASVVTTGLSDLDKAIAGGWRAGRLYVMAGRPGMGKAQPLTALVLTTSGWKLMGEIKIGEMLVHPEGGATRVIAIHPQGKKDIFEVTFHDGRKTECCDDHLWKVKDRHWPDWRILPLSKIRSRQETFRLAIPLRCADGPYADLPIGPYLLGAMLGDGYFHPGIPMFSCADDEIMARMKDDLPDGLNFVNRSGYNYTICAKRGSGPNQLFYAIKSLGLGETRSATKFIPREYFRSSVLQRTQLLQGLLDTDGTVERDKTIRFCSVSRQLADDVVELARSIGGWAKIRQRSTPSFTHRGIKKNGKPTWIVSIRHPDPASLFHLSRKRNRLGNGGQYSGRLKLSFAKIERVREDFAQCITIDREDGLYFTDHHAVTHNSIIALASARRVARKGEACSVYSLEIDANEVLARMASDTLSQSQLPIPYRDIIAGTFDRGSLDFLKKAVERLRGLPMRIDATGGLTMTEIEARIRLDRERFKKEGKRLSVVFIDYLGLIRASDRYRGNKVHELGEIALAAKVMAKKLDIAVVLLAQLSRGVEGRDDKRPVMSDLRDSGNIEEHADFVGLLYRPAYYLERSPEFRKGDPEAMKQFEEQQYDLDLIVGKNRLGPTYSVGLWCNPSLSAIDNKAKF